MFGGDKYVMKPEDYVMESDSNDFFGNSKYVRVRVSIMESDSNDFFGNSKYVIRHRG